jgi:hypothetical protein
MGSEWILGRLAWEGGGGGLDSTVSGQGLVAGCCECGYEPSGSCATELVSYVSSGLYYCTIVSDYRLDDRGSILGRGKRFFL